MRDRLSNLFRRRQLLAVASVLATMWASSTAHAVVISTNPITDANPSSANPFTAGQTVVANITASGIGRGAGITANAGSNRYNAANWTTSAGLDATDYFTWTLTPASGYEIDFTSFVYTGQASGTGPTAFAFRSSADGFVSNIGGPTAAGTTINLSGAAFQDRTTAIEFRLYGFGNTVSGSAAGTFSVNDFTFSGTVNALPANNDTTITAPASAALGRVMLNQTPSTSFNLTKTGNEATTYTATSDSLGLAVTADGNILGGAQSELIGIQLQNVAAGSATTGVKAYQVTIDNTATTTAGAGKGSADANDAVSVSATVVDNRSISATPVNLGNVIKGALTQTAPTSVTTTGGDDHFTRVVVNGTSATDGSVTVAAGSSQLFDGAGDSASRNVAGTFATAGAKSGSVVLSVAGEALTGETVNPVSVGFTANVFDASTAAFLSNAGTMLTVDFGSFTVGGGLQVLSEAIFNAVQTAGFTAELDFDTISGAGDTSLLFTDLMNGEFTALAAGTPNAHSFDIKFDTDNLPGAYSSTYTLKLSDADSYTGAGAIGSQTLTLELKGQLTAVAVPESTYTVAMVLILGLPVALICRRSLA